MGESDDASGRSDEVDVLVVVVNFRTPEMTLECLASLAAEGCRPPRTRVVVVDNGSADGSAERLAAALRERGWSDWARLLALDTNRGFAGGCNAGQALAPGSRHVLMLNSDAIVGPGVIAACRDVMDAQPDVGAMSCLLLNADGSVQNVTRRFPSPLRLLVGALGLPWKLPALFEWADTEDSRWDRRGAPRDVDWIGGAFLMVRGELVRRLGLFDETFFFMGEDIELCHRIRRAGYRCHYDPTVSIVHAGAGSSGERTTPTGWRARQAWRARYLVQRRCYGRAAEMFVRGLDLVTWTLRVPWRRLRRGGEDPSFHEALDTLKLLTGRAGRVPEQP